MDESSESEIIEYVVLDFETSGIDTRIDRVIEVAAVIIDSTGEILSSFEELCSPEENFEVSEFITDLTGITSFMLIGKTDTGTTMRRLFEFVGDRTIIAHNSGFDSRFFRAECLRVGLILNNPFLCTLNLARRLVDCVCYKLSELKKTIDFVPFEGMQDHRAMSDVLVTVQLFKFLLSKITNRVGESLDSFRMKLLLNEISLLKKKNVDLFLDNILDEIRLASMGEVTISEPPQIK